MSTRINVVPVPKQERGKYAEIVVGQAMCPECEQVVLVKNDNPNEGGESSNYFDDHWKDEEYEELCRNSSRPIKC